MANLVCSTMQYALTLWTTWLVIGTVSAYETDPLTGTWVVISTTNGGRDDSQLKDFTATFTDGKVTFKSNDGKVHTATYAPHSDKKPATIDLVPDDGPHKGKNPERHLCYRKTGP
jgi:uncharacterized protein (TIGR03067 family)